MVVLCCVPCCKNYSGKKPILSFYQFPRKDLALRKKWIEAVNPKLTGTNTNFLRVCGDHFIDSDFDRSIMKCDSLIRILKRDAFPNQYLRSPAPVHTETQPVFEECCISECKNTTRNNPNLKFHSFPTNAKVARLWLHEIQSPQLNQLPFESLKTKKVCDQHISENNTPIRFARESTDILNNALNHYLANVSSPFLNVINNDNSKENQSLENLESNAEETRTANLKEEDDKNEIDIDHSINYNYPILKNLLEENSSIQEEYYDFDSICRICLREGELKSVFYDKVENNIINDMFLYCTNLVLSERQKLPKQICINCIKELTIAYRFSKKCEESTIKLMQYINYQFETSKQSLSYEHDYGKTVLIEDENNESNIEDIPLDLSTLTDNNAVSYDNSNLANNITAKFDELVHKKSNNNIVETIIINDDTNSNPELPFSSTPKLKRKQNFIPNILIKPNSEKKKLHIDQQKKLPPPIIQPKLEIPVPELTYFVQGKKLAKLQPKPDTQNVVLLPQTNSQSTNIQSKVDTSENVVLMKQEIPENPNSKSDTDTSSHTPQKTNLINPTTPVIALPPQFLLVPQNLLANCTETSGKSFASTKNYLLVPQNLMPKISALPEAKLIYPEPRKSIVKDQVRNETIDHPNVMIFKSQDTSKNISTNHVEKSVTNLTKSVTNLTKSVTNLTPLKPQDISKQSNVRTLKVQETTKYTSSSKCNTDDIAIDSDFMIDLSKMNDDTNISRENKENTDLSIDLTKFDNDENSLASTNDSRKRIIGKRGKPMLNIRVIEKGKAPQSINLNKSMVIGKAYRCKSCNQVFFTKKRLKAHDCFKKNTQPTLIVPKNATVKIQGKTSNCRKCRITFKDTLELLKHYRECPKHIRKAHCKKCCLDFENMTKLRKHRRQFHITEKMIQEQEERKLRREKRKLTCLRCNIEFATADELADHRKVVHDRRIVSCPICGKNMYAKDLYSHKAGHNQDMKYCCEMCGKTFRNNTNFKRHREIHLGITPYKCEFCERGFRSKHRLTEHVLIHLNEKRNICETCGKAFRQRAGLQTHKRKNRCFKGRGDTLKHECGECEMKFYTHRELKDHKRTSHEPKHATEETTCNICNLKFGSRSAMINHQIIHSETKYVCVECRRPFTSIARLERHQSRHFEEKTCICNVCGKGFYNKLSLKTHLTIHLKEKPLCCLYCPKTFRQQAHLVAHTRVHTGEKPYACPYCDKRFSLNGNLTVHIRYHTGERPYLCNVCNTGYPDSSSLKKHMCRAHLL